MMITFLIDLPLSLIVTPSLVTKIKKQMSTPRKKPTSLMMQESRPVNGSSMLCVFHELLQTHSFQIIRVIQQPLKLNVWHKETAWKMDSPIEVALIPYSTLSPHMRQWFLVTFSSGCFTQNCSREGRLSLGKKLSQPVSHISSISFISSDWVLLSVFRPIKFFKKANKDGRSVGELISHFLLKFFLMNHHEEENVCYNHYINVILLK